VISLRPGKLLPGIDQALGEVGESDPDKKMRRVEAGSIRRMFSECEIGLIRPA
jgi:hypothetical protein